MTTTLFNDTYEIKSIIGKGGMSTVYLAEHKRLQTRWAIKEVSKHQNAHFDFLAESNILKRLKHPMLPTIVDIFEDQDFIYIVEEFVDGVNISDLLEEKGKVDEELGIQWFQDLCNVLDYLHSQQPPIIYRDMKPSNIMLQPDGTLKLIDFGIAREYKQDSSADTTYIGTKGYAAPEQFGRAQTDARTDIHSLGITMYHILTGKSPYTPPYEFVPVRKLDPKLSHGIEFILNKCVQLEPANRYQNIGELLKDLNHIYRFDTAWKRYQNIKRGRVALIAVMLAASIGLMIGGQNVMAQEREQEYASLLSQASSLYLSNYDGAMSALDQARVLFPDRIDPDRQQTYALYLNGQWQECIDFGTQAMSGFGTDTQIRLTMASAQFELGEYEAAAEGFAQSGDLSADNLRDYAVCLGRLKQISEAERILQDLTGQGAHPDVTEYVQGEVFLAQEEYLQAESAFLSALEQAESDGLTRRCYVSLGDLYRECAALARVENSPIVSPATKSAELLSQAVTLDYMRYDSTIWEALALAYFEAYHTDQNVPESYLQRAAECFNRVIELGIIKDYLYTNLYTIYYEMGNYEQAGEALDQYEEAFPQDYMPHALRGVMFITIENNKPQSERDYHPALTEYETAGSMIRSSDNPTYYQQLDSLIQQLRSGGWLS